MALHLFLTPLLGGTENLPEAGGTDAPSATTAGKTAVLSTCEVIFSATDAVPGLERKPALRHEPELME